MYTDDELLPLSGIQHFSFCERQWALIHLEQQWQENLDTTLGELFHERAHLAGYSTSWGVVAERSMRVVSRELGLAGFCDVVEFYPGPQGEGIQRTSGWYQLRPVEYKKGKSKATDCDRLQVMAQAMCLEEMFGLRIATGCLFYGETRRREEVAFEEGLRAKVRVMASEMHALFDLGKTPTATKRPCCSRCSLITECMPETLGKSAREYWSGFGIGRRTS